MRTGFTYLRIGFSGRLFWTLQRTTPYRMLLVTGLSGLNLSSFHVAPSGSGADFLLDLRFSAIIHLSTIKTSYLSCRADKMGRLWGLNIVICISWCAWLIDEFWIGWFDLLILYSHNSGLQAMQSYRYSTHFTVHRCTSTRTLKSSLVSRILETDLYQSHAWSRLGAA
jgi:hypothetical protein